MTKQKKYILAHVATVPNSLYYFFVGQARYMVNQGFEVHGISSPGPLLEQFAEREGVIPHAIKMPRAISPIRDLSSLLQLCRLFKKIKPDIVHGHTPKGGLLGMIAAFLMSVPIRIYHVHGLPYMTATGANRTLLMLTEKISCKLSHRILFVSESVRQIAIADKICTSKKSKIINHGSINGVDAIGHFNPENKDRNKIKSNIGIPSDAKVIGFVGRLVGDKGFRELMTAWESLRKQFEDLYLLVLGDVEKRDAIPQELIDRLRTDPRIKHVGEVRDSVDYYTAMDVIAFPSYREGFSLVTMEASAMEIPLVATRIPGNVDSIVEGETGIFVPIKDAGALEQGLVTYLENRDLKILHGKNGRKRMLAYFKPEDIWKAVHAEYLELIKIKKLDY